MSKNKSSASQSRSSSDKDSPVSRRRQVKSFDSRRTLGPVASLLLRAVAARARTLEQLAGVHANFRRALRSLVDRGLVIERVASDGTVTFTLSASASRGVGVALRKARASAGTAVVVTGVAVRDARRSGRTSTFKA